MQGSYGFLAIIAPLYVVYHGFLVWDHETTPLHSAALLAHYVGVALSALTAPVIVAIWLSHRRREPWDAGTVRGEQQRLRRGEVMRAVWAESTLTCMAGLNGAVFAWAAPLRTAWNCEQQQPGDSGCKFQRQAFIVATMAVLYMAIRPRICFGFPVNFLSLLPPLYVGIYQQGEYTAVDYAAVTIVVGVALAVFTHEVWVTEQLSRQHFLHALELVRAEARIGDLMFATKTIIQAALPLELLNLETMTLVATHHDSNRASVAICEIYDFAQWSTGLLESSVVVVLHGLLAHFDFVAETHGVVRAMSYGDSYIICAGLITCCATHTERAAAWAMAACDVAAFAWAEGVSLHGSACVGPLQGKLSGNQSLRFVLSGVAFESAVTALPEASRGSVVHQDAAAMSREQSIVGSSTSLGTSAAQRASAYFRVDNGPSDHAAEAAASTVHVATDDAIAAYSSATLLFADQETRVGMVTFAANAELGVARFTGLTPLAVLGSLLAVLLIELGSADVTRRTTSPVPFVGLTAGVVICGLAAVVRLRPAFLAGVPHLDYALRFVGLAVAMASLFFGNSAWAAPHLYLGIYAATSMFPRLPWLVQLLLQFVALGVPTIAYTALGYFGVIDSWEIVVVVVTATAIYVRYTWSRAMCDQYAAALLAQGAVTATLVKSEHQHALLAGVLPPHAIAIAKGRIAAGVEQGYVKEWSGLSVLQVAMRGKTVDVPAVLALVDDDGLLEVVQTMGDTYLIAGPFKVGAGDSSKHRSAKFAVALLAALRAANCSFTAVVTAGPAHGALLGAANLTFRLFGAAVRENIALLSASPQPDMLSTVSTCAAFCTDGFRRQHANYALVSANRFDDGCGMSTTLGPAGQSATFGASGASPADVVGDDAVVFGKPALWRVRGVGVASVLVIAFTASEREPASASHVEPEAQRI
jgi:hypothetical protein